MSIERVSAYHVEPLSDGRFECEDAPFDVADYSMMKHGDGLVARRYGRDLADALIAAVPDAVETPKAAMTVPACVYAPKPALAVARAALAGLNRHRAQQDIEPIKEVRMYSDRMGTSAYAGASLEERQQASMRWTDEHHLPTSLIKGAAVFAVDDCIITGTTEKKQIRVLSDYAPASIICAYAVEVDPIKAAEFPGIEQTMNMAAEPNLQRVGALIEQGSFALNSRVLSLILRTEDTHELEQFLVQCPPLLRHELYEATVNSTLEYMGRYPVGLGVLERMINQK